MTRVHYDKAQIKEAAAGRDLEILERVAGIPRENLDGNHHHCHKCGGKDRARYDAAKGFYFCNRCFDKKNGDYIAAVMHFRGVDFDNALRMIGEYLGFSPIANGYRRPPTPTSTAPLPAPAPTNEKATFATVYKALEVYCRSLGEPSTWWEYLDATGRCVGFVYRWDRPEGKAIRPVSRIGERWACCGMPSPRPLYRLRDVMRAQQVFVVEGEKAAEAIWHQWLVATTSASGAKSAHKTDWAPLAGKDVVLLPDNDTAGEQYAAEVLRILRTLSPRPTVRILRLPGLPEKGDAYDYIAAWKGAAA
jgi:hypothetical protein